MPQVTVSISEEASRLIDGAVEGGLYSGRSDAVRDHLRAYIRSNPELAQQVAVNLYTENKIEFISACRLADLSASELQNLIEEEKNND